ncbi:hypothetical protein SISNIDRAFT_486077 [Sistotremastrum niveocremeum HHB9708]|uniref:Acyl-CoA desaturase n=1 Tax=Sistotremastrum niveocremeum HHB9708 TaxID=1314777 RepID=A0A164UEG1_9AGAM|nr:hypothetical protein SISNIDRAFT_486077 [Sistotremastrum niveocremeum HHB9708]
MSPSTSSSSSSRPPIWWSNAIFFVSVHVAALVGAILRPPSTLPLWIFVLTLLLWQTANFGITLGYHRLYSHRAYKASLPVRVAFTLMGSSALQGSIKRYTDDPVNDPYSASRGLFFSHVGWIFFKPSYEKMKLIDRADLDRDPVVRFQHRHYVPLALSTSLVLPAAIGWAMGDTIGAFIWSGLVVRLLVWHSTFLVNSFAHWEGKQPYADDMSARGNFLFALVTAGEGNHNFASQPLTLHAFPHDFRAGPFADDFDPSKWVILFLHKLGLAYNLRKVSDKEIHWAKLSMHKKHEHENDSSSDLDSETESETETWTIQEVQSYLEHPGRAVMIIDNLVVDVSVYQREHPGGAALFTPYTLRSGVVLQDKSDEWKNASWAFNGGYNRHSTIARRRLRQLILARFDPTDEIRVS